MYLGLHIKEFLVSKMLCKFLPDDPHDDLSRLLERYGENPAPPPTPPNLASESVLKRPNKGL